MLFSGQKIWLIGASSGIGMALAHQLAREGASLALSARREEKLNALLQELEGGNHIVKPLDVAQMETIAATAKSIITHFSTLDSVIFLPATYTTDDADTQNISAYQ